MQEIVDISGKAITAEVALQFSDKHEETLVTGAKEDPHAFGELFDKYYNSILNYVLHRTANVGLAEELTSNTFFNALRKLDTFKWRNIPFSAWLYRIASNEINGYFRKNKKKNLSLLDDNIENLSDENSIADIEIKKEEKNIAQNKIFNELHSAIIKVKPKYQEVIILRYFEKKSIKEISQINGKATGTVKSLLHRGLQKLKNEINSSLYEDFINE